jgi:hypothetical protein
MNSTGYYDIEFTPAIGCYYLNNVFGEYDDNIEIPIYIIFLIFPLLSDENFLSYILNRKKTKSLSKLITDYTHMQKSNDFWIDYNIKYLSLRKYCYESLFLCIAINAFELSDNGFKVIRILSKDLPGKPNNKTLAMQKLGKLLQQLDYSELFRIMKVGE